MGGFIAKILVSLIAAAGGAWFGAWRALKKHKGQRRFDAQLRWYTEMVRSMWELQRRLQRRARDLRMADIDEDRQEATLEATRETVDLTAEVFLFGSPRAAKLVWKLRRDLDPIVRRGPSQERSQAAEDMEKMSATVRDYTRKLSLEARNHLDLEELPMDTYRKIREEVGE